MSNFPAEKNKLKYIVIKRARIRFEKEMRKRRLQRVVIEKRLLKLKNNVLLVETQSWPCISRRSHEDHGSRYRRWLDVITRIKIPAITETTAQLLVQCWANVEDVVPALG